MGNLHFHDGCPRPLEEIQDGADSLQNSENFFCTRQAQQAKIFLSEDRTQAGPYSRSARSLKRAAAVDGEAQVAQECNASWAGFDMLEHLVAGARFHFA